MIKLSQLTDVKQEPGKKTVVATEKAPGAIFSYSQTISTDSMVFARGQLPVDPATGVFSGGIEAQSMQPLANAKAIIKAAGRSIDKDKGGTKPIHRRLILPFW